MSNKGSKNERQSQQSDRRLTRRAWIGSAISIAVVGGLLKGRWRGHGHVKGLGTMTAYKSPTCQCCEQWVRRMREYGFAVTEENRADVTPIKRERGVPDALVSCHTGVMDGYVFEGHVPPDLVQQVLRDRPAFAGLAVPGMPQGAPGMEVRPERYEVISFMRTGETAVYAVRA
jgi:hypothetical protein